VPSKRGGCIGRQHDGRSAPTSRRLRGGAKTHTRNCSADEGRTDESLRTDLSASRSCCRPLAPAQQPRPAHLTGLRTAGAPAAHRGPAKWRAQSLPSHLLPRRTGSTPATRPPCRGPAAGSHGLSSCASVDAEKAPFSRGSRRQEPRGRRAPQSRADARRARLLVSPPGPGRRRPARPAPPTVRTARHERHPHTPGQ
jgi:hypothetical protein